MRQSAHHLFLRYHLALMALGSAATIVALFLFNPAESAWYPRCLFHELTGWHCPGCGTLRASYLLLHGDISAALSMNILAVVFLPVYLISYCYKGFRFREWRKFDNLFVSSFAGWSVALIVSAFWILRNIEIEPLTWLAP